MNTYIEKINKLYNGNILLHEPCNIQNNLELPNELFMILKESNGIEESMELPGNEGVAPIAWILYSYEMIVEETKFYYEEYGIEGFVFSDDGAGNPYILKENGEVFCFDAIDASEEKTAESLEEFWT